MRISSIWILPVVVGLGCSANVTGGPGDAAVGGATGGSTGGAIDGGAVDHVSGQADAAADIVVAQPDGAIGGVDVVSGGDVGTIPTPDGGTGGTGSTGWQAGNPSGSCTAGVPANGRPVDTTTPTTVVGTGAGTCTFAALRAAVANGGIVTFNCGTGATTILVTATITVPTNKNTVIDGGNKITLDGGNAVQILNFNGPDFQANNNGLTLQHIALINGKKTGTMTIPTAPAPCSQGSDDGEGGALYMNDGNLVVIDSIFTNNQAALLGPDTGGGAIYVLGSKNGVVIVGSTFSNNRGSNAAAVGGLFAKLSIYNSLFQNNTATGNGANYDDATMCSVINNGQHEVGSGGNGGAIYSDGASVDVTLCGDAVLNNTAGANAFGGGLFFTSNDMNGVLSITDTRMTGNTGGHWTNAASGSVTDVGTAIGVNARSITVVNSSLQGRP